MDGVESVCGVERLAARERGDGCGGASGRRRMRRRSRRERGERKHLKNYPNSQEGWDSSPARAVVPRPTPNTY